MAQQGVEFERPNLFAECKTCPIADIRADNLLAGRAAGNGFITVEALTISCRVTNPGYGFVDMGGERSGTFTQPGRESRSYSGQLTWEGVNCPHFKGLPKNERGFFIQQNP